MLFHDKGHVGGVQLKNPLIAAVAEHLIDADGVRRALAELGEFLARKNVRAAELVGRAADRRKTFAEMPLHPDNWRRYVPT